MMISAISVIVPVYKVPEKFFRKCVESIQQQTLQNIEIILIDDGSPDNCGKICDEYAATDTRIRVIHKNNGGLAAARNTGVLESTTDWIMFVDGDDWIEPNMCEEMYRVANANHAQVVLCGSIKDYISHCIKFKYTFLEKLYKSEECLFLQEQLLHFNAQIATAYSKLISKRVLLENNIFHDEVLRQGAEGLDFNLRLFENIENAYFLNKHFYHYMYNDESISASHNEQNHEYVIRCFEKIKEFIKTSKNKDNLMNWFDNRLLYVIITTAISGYFNPSNTEPYIDKKRKYGEYLRKPIVAAALKTSNLNGLSVQRKLVLWLIKNRLFFMLSILGKIRKLQKDKNRIFWS